MDRSERGNLVALRQCAKRRQAEQYALVLTAMGVSSSIAPEGKVITLYVAHEDAARANDELTAYDSENRKHLPGRGRGRPAFPRIEVVMIYWAVLLFFFAAARREAFSLDWVSEGAAQAGLMLEGEWWSAVTALCLHISAAHLLGNLVFGTVFFLLLAQVTGAGVAWLSMIAAGAAGNALNAIVQSTTHTSIGASTAIFAGIGLLAALRQVRRPERAISSLRSWVPVAGGATLLVFRGLSGEQTDILAMSWASAQALLQAGCLQSGTATGPLIGASSGRVPALPVWSWLPPGSRRFSREGATGGSWAGETIREHAHQLSAGLCSANLRR